MTQQLTEGFPGYSIYIRDVWVTNEWPYNKCVDTGAIMLQMCVWLCGEMLSEPSS